MRTINILTFLISCTAILILYFHLTGATNFLKDNIANFALLSGLLIPFSLLFLGYTQLRALRIYAVWLLLGAAMLLFYFHFKDFPVLQMKRGSALRSFKSLLVFLILFQVGRIVFIKIAGREYVTPSIGGTEDIVENKKPQFADFILFGLLFLSIIVAQEI